MKKRVILLIAILVLSILGGCKKSTNEEKASSMQGKEYIYTFESLGDKLEGRELSQNVVLKDRIIFMGYRYEEVTMPETEGVGEEIVMPEAEGLAEEIIVEEAAAEVMDTAETAIETDMSVDMPVEDFSVGDYIPPKTFLDFIQCDYEGNILSEFEIEQPADSGVHNMCADDSGNVYFVLCEYGKDTSTPDVYRDLYTLQGYTSSGEEFFKTVLGQQCAEDENYYINTMICTEDGGLYLWSTVGLEIFDKNGTLIKTVPLKEEEAGSMFCLRDGSIAMQYYGEQNQYFKKLDMETGEFSEKIEVPYNTYNYAHYAGTVNDFVLVDSIGVFTYNFGDDSVKKIMDFVDSDMTANTCYSITQLAADRFFAWIYDEFDGTSKYGIFTKVNPASIPDKKVLTLGVQWLDNDVRKRVVEFNKNSTEYRISIEDYNQYNTAEDYTAGAVKLNTDIAMGNAPDILCLTGDMPIASYMSKGLFVDLKTLIENDPELKMEDYMTEVIDAFSYEGKWYQLVPSYYLFTVWGKTADVGEEPGFTFDELKMLRSKKGQDAEVFAEQTKTSIVSYSMMFNSDQYINWETGECYFNTPEFINLLEFANEFPKEINYEELYNDMNYWESQETMFRDGRALLMPSTISNFQDFIYAEQGTFGEQITAIGFPVKEGVGNAYSSNQNFAISAKSDCQDAAWEFLRYYLTDEYQDELEYGWPIKLSSLNKRMEAAMKRPSYIDENGNTVEYDDTYYIGGVDIVLSPLTQEDCDRVIGFLKSADHVYSYNTNIMNILEEECAAYFEGQKSAKEVADIIQSRIRIYVNENM